VPYGCCIQVHIEGHVCCNHVLLHAHAQTTYFSTRALNAKAVLIKLWKACQYGHSTMGTCFWVPTGGVCTHLDPFSGFGAKWGRMAPIELNSLGHRGAVELIPFFTKLHACTYTTYMFRHPQFCYVPLTLPMCCSRRPSYTNSINSKIRARVNMAYPISHLGPKIRETKSIVSIIHLRVAKDHLATSTDPLRPIRLLI
jgi:hypothetical protein